MGETDHELGRNGLVTARRPRVRVFCRVGPRDTDIMPAFVAHYRDLGVDAFYFFARGDEAAAACRRQTASTGDIEIKVAATASGEGTDDGEALREAIRPFAGDWALVADPDEFLELPYRRLPATIRALNAFGLESLPGFRLDRVAADGRPDRLGPGDDPQAIFPLCSPPAGSGMAVMLFRVRDDQTQPRVDAALYAPLRAAVHRFRQRHAAQAGRTFPYARKALFDRGLLRRPDGNQICDLVMKARRARTLLGAAEGNDVDRLDLSCRRLRAAWDRPEEAPDLLRPRAAGLLGSRGHIAYVTFEFAGLTRGGGVGTAVATEVARLAADGHRLSVLFCPFEPDPGDRPSTDDWMPRDVRFDRSRHRLNPALDLGDQLLTLGYEVMQWIRDRNPDIVHFHDYLGLGAMTAAAQKQGLMPAAMRIIVTAHGCTRWLLSGNGRAMTIDRMRIAHGEREQFRHADHVTFLSAFMLDWLRRKGEPLPSNVHVRRNLTVANVRGLRSPKPDGWRPDEIVFFGRIEIHKGIDVFCRAVTCLIEQGRRDFGVTLLGRRDNEERTRQLIADATAGCSLPFRHLGDLSTADALDYLREADAIAVMPSRSDNLPFTVLECIDNGIPFLAAPVGGIPEMIAPDDRDRVLRAGSAENLASALSDALDNGHAPARPAFDQDDVELRWLAWHGEIMDRVAEARATAADVSVAAEKTAIDVCAYGADAASGSVLSPDRSGHAASANRLAATGDRPYLLFVHRSVEPDPELESTFLSAAVNCGADAVVGGFRVGGRSDGEAATGSRTELVHATAGPFSLLPYRNTYGAPVFLITRAAFDRLGGFADDDHLRGIEHWDLLNRLVLAGGEIAAVPLPLATMTAEAREAGARALPEWVTARLAAPFLEQAPPPWRDAFHLLGSTVTGIPYPKNVAGPGGDLDSIDASRLKARLRDMRREHDGLMLSRGALLRQFIRLNIERSPLRRLWRRSQQD